MVIWNGVSLVQILCIKFFLEKSLGNWIQLNFLGTWNKHKYMSCTEKQNTYIIQPANLGWREAVINMIVLSKLCAGKHTIFRLTPCGEHKSGRGTFTN